MLQRCFRASAAGDGLVVDTLKLVVVIGVLIVLTTCLPGAA